MGENNKPEIVKKKKKDIKCQVEKERQSRARKKVAVGMAILCRGQGGLPEVMTLKQRPEGSQQASPVDNWGKSIPGGENGQSKGLEAGGPMFIPFL